MTFKDAVTSDRVVVRALHNYAFKEGFISARQCQGTLWWERRVPPNSCFAIWRAIHLVFPLGQWRVLHQNTQGQGLSSDG